MFLLSGDVQLRMFLLTPTLFYAKPITNAFDVFMLSRDKMLRGSSTRKFSRIFVTGLMCPLMTKASSKSPTPADKLQILSTMLVSVIVLLLASTFLLESLIVYICSSVSKYIESMIVDTSFFFIGD